MTYHDTQKKNLCYQLTITALRRRCGKYNLGSFTVICQVDPIYNRKSAPRRLVLVKSEFGNIYTSFWWPPLVTGVCLGSRHFGSWLVIKLCIRDKLSMHNIILSAIYSTLSVICTYTVSRANLTPSVITFFLVILHYPRVPSQHQH